MNLWFLEYFTSYQRIVYADLVGAVCWWSLEYIDSFFCRVVRPPQKELSWTWQLTASDGEALVL